VPQCSTISRGEGRLGRRPRLRHARVRLAGLAGPLVTLKTSAAMIKIDTGALGSASSWRSFGARSVGRDHCGWYRNRPCSAVITVLHGTRGISVKPSFRRAENDYRAHRQQEQQKAGYRSRRSGVRSDHQEACHAPCAADHTRDGCQGKLRNWPALHGLCQTPSMMPRQGIATAAFASSRHLSSYRALGRASGFGKSFGRRLAYESLHGSGRRG
jgi:hypothetical protein